MSEPAKATKPCPICGKPAVEKYRPFCSRRCADVDLNRWLSGSYVIPASVDSEPEDDDEVPMHSRDPEDDNI